MERRNGSDDDEDKENDGAAGSAVGTNAASSSAVVDDVLQERTDLLDGEEVEDEDEVEEEEEAESITPGQLVGEIAIAWQNEICAPRLLPHKEKYVDLMVDQLEAMEDNFSRCDDQTSLKIILHKMEVQRLAYMINEYIRERLKKIEKDVEVLQNENAEREKSNSPGLLSAAEKSFCERYEKMKRHLMETCFLDRIPPALQRLPITSLDLSAERVIAEVTGNGMEQASVPDLADPMSDRPVELRPGSVHFIPYPSIADLLEAERVRLL